MVFGNSVFRNNTTTSRRSSRSSRPPADGSPGGLLLELTDDMTMRRLLKGGSVRIRLRFSYFASIHLSDPVSLTARSEMKIRSGLPSAVPRWSVEIERGPAFL